MTTFRQLLITTLIAGLAHAGAALAAAPATTGAQGVWSDEDNKSNIEIAPCGNSLCGRVIWLAQPFDASGRPKTDINNPNASQRTRPIIGLTIIKDLLPYDGNRQLKGVVYNAEDGKVYDIYLNPKGRTMEVEGCFALFLCGSQTWRRVK